MGFARLELFVAIELVATVLMLGLCRAAMDATRAMWIAA